MITSLTDKWISQLEQAAFRHGIVFVHLGDAFPLTREVLLGRVPKVYSPSEYLEAESAESAESGLIVITDLEIIGQIEGAEFGPLRARVHEDVDKNSQVVLLSRFPRERFPNVPGSPLLFEAKLVTPPVYQKEGFGAEAIDQGHLSHLVLKCAIRELGESLCGSLDKALFEEKDPSSLTGLDAEILGELRSSGLVFLENDNFVWAPPVDETTAQETLSAVVSEMRVPQLDLADVAKHCWTIERTLKQALRARANVLWKENWRGELLDDECLQAAAVDRARASAYPEADIVNDLRDPLELAFRASGAG